MDAQKLKGLFDMTGRVVVVTGGTRGIGRALAEGYVSAGAKVVVASRKAEVCDQVAAELSEFGECVSVPADLSTRAGVDGLAAEIAGREAVSFDGVDPCQRTGCPRTCPVVGLPGVLPDPPHTAVLAAEVRVPRIPQ